MGKVLLCKIIHSSQNEDGNYDSNRCVRSFQAMLLFLFAIIFVIVVGVVNTSIDFGSVFVNLVLLSLSLLSYYHLIYFIYKF